jgi:hypothetical protein
MVNVVMETSVCIFILIQKANKKNVHGMLEDFVNMVSTLSISFDSVLMYPHRTQLS